ncbi:hypothetical protein ACWEOA_03090 [Streptomyces sp. NPDC004457]
MRLRLREFRPRTGPHEYRIIQPRHTLRHTSLRAPDPVGMLLGDHDGLDRLAALFAFAARSPHTIVHVPLRDGVPPDEGVGEPVDLLLVHESLGLRPSRWPDLRRRLRQGTPLTVRTDEARTARDAAAWTERRDRADFRGDLRHATHARTFFLFGHRHVFAGTATRFADAAGRGPYQKRVGEGRMAYLGSFLPLVDVPGGGHPAEVMVCFKARPPYAHFRPPGAPASRPRRPAAAS